MSDKADPQIPFQWWLAKAEGRISELRRKVNRSRLRTLEQEAQRCESLLETMQDHAIKHNISIHPYMRQFAKMHADLQNVRLTVDSRRGSFWKRIGHTILHALTLIADFTGISSVFTAANRLLGFTRRDRYLPPPSDD